MCRVGFLRNQLLQRVKPLHRKMREQKIDLFWHLVGGPGERTTLLDVRGGTGIDGEFLRLYSSFTRVVIVNLHVSLLPKPNGVCVASVKADRCALPFESRSFDWVFPNAVIEHAGHITKRRRLAKRDPALCGPRLFRGNGRTSRRHADHGRQHEESHC